MSLPVFPGGFMAGGIFWKKQFKADCGLTNLLETCIII